MKDWLCKEYVVKRKRWGIIVDIVLESILIGIILYYLVSDCGNAIVEVITEVKKNDVVFDMVLILMPIILIFSAMFKIGFYICNSNVPKSPVFKNNSTKTSKTAKTVKKTKKR